jgi:hypothetical protein
MEEAGDAVRRNGSQDSTHSKARQARRGLPWEEADSPSSGQGERATTSEVSTCASLRGSTLRPSRDATVVQAGRATSLRDATGSRGPQNPSLGSFSAARSA